MLYNPSYDDTYFVTHFLGGLKDEIHFPITLHRPQNVDIASALALLQEEELLTSRRSGISRSGAAEASKPVHKPFYSSDKTKPKQDINKTSEPKQLLTENRRGSVLSVVNLGVNNTNALPKCHCM